MLTVLLYGLAALGVVTLAGGVLACLIWWDDQRQARRYEPDPFRLE